MDMDESWSNREIKKALSAYDFMTKLFRCNNCSGYLIPGKLYLCKCVKITCGCSSYCYSCSSDRTESNIDQINSLLNLMQYSCKWKCGKRESSINIKKHELQCERQSIDCPLLDCNQSKGDTVEKIGQHLSQCHTFDFILNDDTPFYEFKYSDRSIKYFSFGMSTFILSIDKPTAEKTSFKVQCIKSNFKPESFMFEIRFVSSEAGNDFKMYGDVYSFFSDAEPLIISCNLIKKKTYDSKLYKNEGQFRILVDNNSVESCTQLEVETNHETLNEPNVNDLTGEVTCPVCLKIITSQIYQCKNGHIICSSCINHVESCPICRIDIREDRSRSLVLEAIMQKLIIPCENHVNGCSERIAISKAKEHELKCPFKITKCPFKLVLDVKCEWSGLQKNFLIHLNENSHNHVF